MRLVPGWFELSARPEYEYRGEGSRRRVVRAGTRTKLLPTAKYRRWWLERFERAELVELATIIWDR